MLKWDIKDFIIESKDNVKYRIYASSFTCFRDNNEILIKISIKYVRICAN